MLSLWIMRMSEGGERIDKNTTSIAKEDPCKVLKQTSLPNLSVPQKWLSEGGAKISLLNIENE